MSKRALVAAVATGFLWTPATATAQGPGTPQCMIDVSLDIGPGEVIGNLGASGAGKSTTLRLSIGSFTGDDAGASLAQLRQELGRDPHQLVPADRCLRDLLGWLGSSGTAGSATAGRPFEPGYLLFDWNDNGAMAPLLGFSTGLPIAAGVAPTKLTSLSGGTDLKTLFVAYDPVDTGIAANIGMPAGDTPGSGAVESPLVGAAREANAKGPGLTALRPLSSASVSLFDKTGDSTFELRCAGNVQAFRYGPLTGATVANLLSGGRVAEQAALLLISCPGGFRVY